MRRRSRACVCNDPPCPKSGATAGGLAYCAAGLVVSDVDGVAICMEGEKTMAGKDHAD